MSTQTETSDKQMLDLLRKQGPLTISALVDEMGVTATAVRQRIQRLTAEGLIERQAEKNGRGRPNHRYSLTRRANNRQATTLPIWRSCCGKRSSRFDDPEIRRGLLRRIADRFVERYRDDVVGDTLDERMT